MTGTRLPTGAPVQAGRLEPVPAAFGGEAGCILDEGCSDAKRRTSYCALYIQGGVWSVM